MDVMHPKGNQKRLQSNPNSRQPQKSSRLGPIHTAAAGGRGRVKKRRWRAITNSGADIPPGALLTRAGTGSHAGSAIQIPWRCNHDSNRCGNGKDAAQYRPASSASAPSKGVSGLGYYSNGINQLFIHSNSLTHTPPLFLLNSLTARDAAAAARLSYAAGPMPVFVCQRGSACPRDPIPPAPSHSPHEKRNCFFSLC